MRRLGYSIEVTMLNRATEKAIESLYRNKLGTTWMCLRRKNMLQVFKRKSLNWTKSKRIIIYTGVVYWV